MTNWDKETHNKLLTNDVDIGINYYPLDISKQIYQKKIAQDKFVAVVRNEHPLANKKLSEVKEKEIEIAQLLVPDWNDKTIHALSSLASIGIEGKLKYRSTYLHSILSVVRSKDILFPCSKLFADTLGSEFSQVILANKLIEPSGDIGLYVSRQSRNQPFVRWLQQVIQEQFES